MILAVAKLIPKFKGVKKICTVDDFRGITICPILSKIFQLCLIKYFNVLPTSERQFGFKKGSSCHLAIHSVTKVINYFVHKGSTINLGAIDLKKAFDTVSHFGLLCILQEKQIDIKLINILENWLCKSRSVIDWDGITANPVICSAGVRQGGGLSSVLFSIFVDVLLKKCNSNTQVLVVL